MDTRSAANSVVKAVCRGDKRDMTMNPLAILIVILGFVVFSVYYMVIVHDIESYAALPLFFSLAVLILVLIACFTPLFIVYLLLIRNRRHSEREKDLRAAIMDYLEASGTDVIENKGLLEDLRRTDAEIKNFEVTPSPKKLIYLAVPGIIVSIICWATPVINDHLGEVSYILIVAFLLLGMTAFPSITSMPYEHEKRFMGFYGLAAAAFRDIGVELDEFPVTVNDVSYDKMRLYSMITLGAYSVYWAYVCLSSMNKHFAAHRRIEFTLISSLKGTFDRNS